jgi:C1A family cysteine protease
LVKGCKDRIIQRFNSSEYQINMMKKPTKKNGRPGLGWMPDLPDNRDHLYAAPLAKLRILPSKVDLRKQCPKVYNQGEIGSCTANAIAAAIEFDRKKQKLSDFVPSRLFIYYNERSIEHSVPLDNGAQIRDGIKSVAKQGACPEREWPYDDTPANPNTNLWPAGAKPAQKPPKSCYTDAKKFRAVSYQRVDRMLAQFKGCLADGYPFVFGFTVYESFESAEVGRTGVLKMPKPGEGVVGGHAVLAVGYNDQSQCFIVRNSWGRGWGQKGYFTMPYSYLLTANLSDDFWTIRLVH